MDVARGSTTGPLVSIITPAFAAAAFLEECVDSVLAQTYPHVEHIVQDGASPDGTTEILARYSGRVDWVSAPDRGQADGLDRALKRSRGDFLLVLNADDVLLPDAAEWAVRAMARHPHHAVIYGDLYLIAEDGEIVGRFIGPEYDFASVLCVEKVLPAQAAFMRRSALEAVGLGADPTLDTCPDYEMMVRLGLRFPMRHVPGFVAKYRVHDRPMDGTEPRSVRRFVDAKARVMERVFDSPDTPPAVRGLRHRARAGLLLWASEEARNMADRDSAWRYFVEALSQFGISGRLVRRVIVAARRVARAAGGPGESQSPNWRRALLVGGDLVRGSPRARVLARRTRFLARRLRVIVRVVFGLGLLIVLALFAVLLTVLILRLSAR